ncbi:MAG: hypothetical protein IT169_14220 [Bryobacterales bacterium]|nr:hypothetical protein [Bryobacterales bacterium]
MRHPSRRRFSTLFVRAGASAALLLLWASCGPVPKEAAPAAEPAATAPRPAAEDVSRYLSNDGQVKVQLVEDHLLGIQALPGGNIAEYSKGGKRYRQFLLKAPSVALAAVYMTDLKDAMSNPKFVAGFGGYFGELNGEPAFVFIKNEYVTGFLGLSREESDAAGRIAAARIP